MSIVIPARNDAEALARTLDHLERHRSPAVELIVAATGPRAAAERAVRDRARLIWPEGSTRAHCMNAGAAVARGDVLFFLHADSFPPPDAIALIGRALADPRAVGGAFEHLFAEPVWSLRVITSINRIRYRLTRNYYGDQGIFVRASVFQAVGGYPDLALMEDIVLSQRLWRRGHYVLLRTPLLTSGRRFLARGPWRTFFFIVWLLLLHTLRLDTQGYAERWRGPAGLPARRRRRRALGGPGACRRGYRAVTLVMLAVMALGTATANATLIARVEPVATRYHEDAKALDRLYEDLTRAAEAEPRFDVLVALARIAFVWGDARATSPEQKLAAYDLGRQAARRAVELDRKSAPAHFWHAANTARWGQVKGVVRSLFLLPDVQRGIDTVLELDPLFPAVYALAGNVYYEVPGLLGGDIAKAEAMFRRGLELDPHFTAMRVALARTLIRRGRVAEARRELERVLAESAPTNPANFTVQDVPEAKRILDSTRNP